MQTREWLDERRFAGVKLGLDNCRTLLSRLGDPQLAFPSIHVAGTNGKGSVCVLLSAAATRAGLKTGLYTTPHLITVEERVRVDGKPISPVEFDAFVEQVRQAACQEPKLEPTFYEVTFIVAMLAFREAGVERGIIETGLGGRLDATRLVDADLTLITSIGLDHTEFLGETLPEIAAEKAAIHRDGVPLIVAEIEDENIRAVFENEGADDLYWWDNSQLLTPEQKNHSLASAVCQSFGWEFTPEGVRWPGRFGSNLSNRLALGTRISAAHNSAGIESELKQITESTILVLGLSEKANLEEVIQPLRQFLNTDNPIEALILTEPLSGRNPAVPAAELAQILLNKVDLPAGDESNFCMNRTNPIEAIEDALILAGKTGAKLHILGSVYLVGDILSYIIERDELDLWQELTVH